MSKWPLMPNNRNDLVVVQKIPGWEKLKALVLDSVSSPITKRVYNMALDEFLAWFQQPPRPGFTMRIRESGVRNAASRLLDPRQFPESTAELIDVCL
jgi:hypothetical protein